MRWEDQFRALGADDLPAQIRVGDRAMRLESTFKHNSVAAVGLYVDGGERVVLKCYRRAPFLGFPLAWTGRLMARHEAAVLCHVEGVPGVPAWRGLHGDTGLLRDYVPGEPLTRRSDVGRQFIVDLFRMLRELHGLGVAYVDLEKAENILVGQDGRPHLIDFQVAYHVPERFLGETFPFRWLRGWLQRADLYHARKHMRRLLGRRIARRRADRLRRKPWPVRVGNLIRTPYGRLRRWALGRNRCRAC
jgi:hypothetical protein